MNLKNLLTPLPPVTSPPTRVEYPGLAFYTASLTWQIDQIPRMVQALTPWLAILIILHPITIHGFTETFVMETFFIAMFAAAIMGALAAVDRIFEKARTASKAVVLACLIASAVALYAFGGPAFALIGLGVLSYGSGKLIKAWAGIMQTTYLAIRDVGAVGEAKLRQTWTALQSRPPSFNLGPMMVMAKATTEHRPESARGFNQTRDTGHTADDEGNGKHEKAENHDPSHHGDKSSWTRLLAQLRSLRNEFYEIKNGKEDTASASQRVMD